jgi:hypothetical protein
MFVCLSSGSSARYREDIMRSVALPKGMILQFRYDQKYLTPGVSAAVDANQAVGESALIVYIDQHLKAESPNYVACRYAKVVRVSRHGTTVSVELTLDNYAYAANLGAFNQWMTSTFPQELPTWENGKLQGKYWLENVNEPNSAVRSSDLADWQSIVGQLAAHDDFTEEKFFHTVTAFGLVSASKPLVPTAGSYHVESGKTYEMTIYHYHPTATPTSTLIEVSSANAALEFITNPVLRIDSRYDQKVIRFQVTSSNAKRHAFLTLVRRTEGETAVDWQYDLPLVLKGRFFQTLGFGLLLGGLLVAPQVTAVLLNPSLSHANACLVVTVSIVASLFAGMLAAFGLKKPI